MLEWHLFVGESLLMENPEGTNLSCCDSERYSKKCYSSETVKISSSQQIVVKTTIPTTDTFIEIYEITDDKKKKKKRKIPNLMTNKNHIL